MPPASIQPYSSEVPRCAHAGSMSPTRPNSSRKRIKSSPSQRTRRGASEPCSCEKPTGSQYFLSVSPAGVPGPTRDNNSFSSASMRSPASAESYRVGGGDSRLAARIFETLTVEKKLFVLFERIAVALAVRHLSERLSLFLAASYAIGGITERQNSQ